MVTKKGFIFSTDGSQPWSKTHTQVPTVDVIGEKFRIYYSTRDNQNRSLTSYIDVNANNPQEILYVHNKPILDFGKLGTFDDCGVMPSFVINFKNRKLMYYCGWNTSTTVRYRNSIGLMESIDGGDTWSRMFEGPILDRTKDEPYMPVTPCIIEDDGVLKMWYCATTEWKMINGNAEPQYLIKYAESKDGINWDRPNHIVIPYNNDYEAIGRPSVIKENGIYKMWYCYRTIQDYRLNKNESYKIGYAESTDNKTWVRKDELCNLELAESGWDSQMLAYPYVVIYKNKKYLFYNGNNFGQGGFGYAIID